MNKNDKKYFLMTSQRMFVVVIWTSTLQEIFFYNELCDISYTKRIDYNSLRTVYL